MQRLIKKIIIYALILIIAAFGIILAYIWLKNDHAEQLNAANAELNHYRETYDPIGGILTAYTIISDTTYGSVVLEEDIIEIDVPETIAENLIFDPEEIIGKYYRINLTAGTPITYDVLMDFPQTSDERAYDVITTFNPIGLEPNDFVDIRFVTPMGEDYIALSHKRVEGVYGGVLKLAMSEYDIMVYNSLLVDKILFKGSMIYATKYLNPGGQEASEAFYPLSYDVILSIYRDPNISLDIDYREMQSRRATMVAAYEQYSEDPVVASLLESGKAGIASIIQGGQSEYQTQKEIEEQRRLEEAIINGGG